MYIEERQQQIAEMIKQVGTVSVSKLASAFGKSEETIRRDLRSLEKYGMIKRTRGGAKSSLEAIEILKEKPTTFRQCINMEQKLMIAKRAAEFVNNNDVILLDDSTTVSFLLRFLPKNYYLTILTNSLQIINQLQTIDNDSNWTAVCLGGILKSKTSSLTGFLALQTLSTFRPQKMFMSCGGIDWQGNITEGSLSAVELKKEFVSRCDEIYLMLDDSKVGSPASVNLMEMKDVDYLLVSGMDGKRLDKVKKMGAKQIITV